MVVDQIAALAGSIFFTHNPLMQYPGYRVSFLKIIVFCGIPDEKTELPNSGKFKKRKA